MLLITVTKVYPSIAHVCVLFWSSNMVISGKELCLPKQDERDTDSVPESEDPQKASGKPLQFSFLRIPWTEDLVGYGP